MNASPRRCLAVAALLSVAWAPSQAPDPEWTAWTTEVPLIDLSGEWEFVPDESDAMIEEWSGTTILYRIEQGSAVIRLEFVPEGSTSNVQVYRWDGNQATLQRGGEEVREPARWLGGGRRLRIEGRRWGLADQAVTKYTFEYRLERPGLLLFAQADEFGETVGGSGDVSSLACYRRTATSGSAIRSRCTMPSISSTQIVLSGEAAIPMP